MTDEQDQTKTVVVLEQTGSYADEPESLHARGYSVKEVKEEACDHPSTHKKVTNESKVVESCNVCGAKEEQEITTDLSRDSDGQ